MQLEDHQLDRRWGHLRVRHPARQRRLLASLAEVGRQTPIVVVEAEGQADRYVVIDGYKRIAALEQLGRDSGSRGVADERGCGCAPGPLAAIIHAPSSVGGAVLGLARRRGNTKLVDLLESAGAKSAPRW